MLDGYNDSYYKTFRTGPGYTVLSIAKATFSVTTIMLYVIW